MRKGIELLKRCDEMVSKLGLFSSNENKDDVNTSNLKYLLVRLIFLCILLFVTLCLLVMIACNGFNILCVQVPFYLGELTEKVAQEDRIPILKASQDHLKVNLNSFAIKS